MHSVRQKTFWVFLATSFILVTPRVSANDQSIPTAAKTRSIRQVQTPGSTGTHGVSSPSTILTALVFVPVPEEVVNAGVVAHGVEFRGVAVPNAVAFRKLVSTYLNKPMTPGLLDRLRSAIAVYYRDHDRPAIDVVTPPQDVTNGVLQIVLLEAHGGQIRVIGNKWFSSASYRDALQLQPGDPIRSSVVQNDVDWINQNPFREANVVYGPGAELGETDVTIRAKDIFPLRGYAGYNDSGTALTGFQRYYAGFDWGNVFGLGHQFNYQFTTSGDGSSLRANSASYLVPLAWHDTFTLSGSYVDSRGVQQLTTQTGNFWNVSARYAHQLPRLPNYQQEVTAGFDFKHNRNALQFGGVTFSNTPSDIDQFVLGYDGREKDKAGVTSANLQLYGSPGGLIGDNSNSDFAAVRTYSRSQYAYGNLSIERRTNLPANFTWVERGTFQLATANLQPSEELGFGGEDSIRGYDEREVNADNGFIFNTELRAPPISLTKLIGEPQFHDSLRFLAFWDYGGAYDERRVPGDPTGRYLSSIGVGFKYHLIPYVTAYFDYGWQQHRTGLDSDHGSRADAGVVLSY